MKSRPRTNAEKVRDGPVLEVCRWPARTRQSLAGPPPHVLWIAGWAIATQRERTGVKTPDGDTRIGGTGDRFPPTRLSALQGLHSEDPEVRRRSGEAIISAYWKPVYKYIRVKWRAANADAKDLTQGFFSAVLEKDFFRRYQPEKSRFRTFLRVCLDGYLSKERQAAQRIKRGGQVTIRSLDYDAAEEEIARDADRPDQDLDGYFQQEWTRHVLELALNQLEAECARENREQAARLFRRHLFAEENAPRPTFADLAREFGLTPTEVNAHVTWARRHFRTAFLENLRALTATEEEYHSEVRALLGPDEA